MAAYPRFAVLGRGGSFSLAKSHTHGEIGEVDPGQCAFHRLDQPWVALQGGGGASRFLEEIIERQRAMPLEGLAKSEKVLAHCWMIYPHPCGMPPANTHSARLGAVSSEELPLRE